MEQTVDVIVVGEVMQAARPPWLRRAWVREPCC